MDAWVKSFKSSQTPAATIEKIKTDIEECMGNIQHNYELLNELQEEIRNIKTDLTYMKAVAIISMQKLDITT